MLTSLIVDGKQLESTALSKCFAKQGVKIPIRKEPRINRNKRLTGQESSNFSEASPPFLGASGDREMVSESEDDDDGQE